MENWLKPKWETAQALTYHGYYSVNDWKNNSYLVAQAIADSPLGPYTKLTESEGGVILSGMKQGSQTSSGTGHHSILQAGNQLLMVYHRHNDPSVAGSGGANLKYLNDGLLSHLKNGNTNVTNVMGETTITDLTTFTFRFDEARPVKSVMVYNSRLEGQIFRQIKQIRLVCVEDGKSVVKYTDNVPFNTEYFKTNSSGKVTYVEPCAAAYAVFGELPVLSVEITMEIPAGQSSVGISEIRILGK